MRHLLLSGAALLALVYPANSVTMQIGYMGQDITGPPDPYTFVVTATSNGNIISDHRMVGTWEVTVMGSTDGVNSIQHRSGPATRHHQNRLASYQSVGA